MSIPAAVRSSPFVAMGLAAVLHAQAPCTNAWQPGDPIAGLDGTAYAMVVGDPDGVGPLPTGVVVGGEFTVAGAHRVTNVAFYEPLARQWLPIGSLPARVTSLLVRANGRVVASSTFGGVHEFDGGAWQRIGPSSSQPFVSALAELPNGDLVVGGNITPGAGIPGNGILRWDGTQWLAMGNPAYLASVGTVLAMARLPNGDLVAGGLFDHIGGVPCSNIARWNGTAWQPLGTGVQSGVTQMAASAAGEVLVDGDFGAGSRFGRWDGTSWQPVTTFQQPSFAFPIGAHGGNGVLFRANGGLFVHTPAGWSNLVPWAGNVSVACAALLGNGDVVVGGGFVSFEGQPTLRVAHRVAGSWLPAGTGAAGNVGAVLELADGSFVAGGTFPWIGGTATARLARFDGNAWAPLGIAAVDVTAMLQRPDGELLLAGAFPQTVGSARLVRWQGGVATPLPLSANQTPVALVLSRDGSALIAVQEPAAIARVLRWDGNSLLPTPIVVVGVLSDLVEMHNGDLVVSGSFLTGTGGASVLRWDGVQLRAIFGAPTGPQQVLAVAGNGDLLVGGDFLTPAARIVRWDGAAWHPLGGGVGARVVSIETLPDGDVVVACRLGATPGLTTSSLQRFDGAQWTAFGVANGAADLAWLPSGSLVAYGDFARVDNQVAGSLAFFDTSCRASVLDLGGGCSGSAGLVELRIATRAWLGAATRTVTSGIPANALAIGVFGASPVTLPLQPVLPIAGAGCTLRAAPDVLLLLPVVDGAVSVQWTLPSTPTLVGVSFAQQTVVLESAAGVATLVTTSNAAQLSVGSF
jgi:hypothetical protein